MSLSLEEVALRILCAQIQTGKHIGNINVREAFAMAVTFQELAKEVHAGIREPARFEKLAHDDNGL